MTTEGSSAGAERGSRDISAGVVLYADSLPQMSEFYAAVLGLTVTETESYHVVLESSTYQLTVVETPAHLAEALRLAHPPGGRRETAVKLIFVVANLAAARAVAADHGGRLLPPEREWRFQDWTVCDGHDPEGNAIQLRERV